MPERIDPTGTRSTVPRDSASKRVTDDSQVRVTGKITSRGGIHAILVSEISSANGPGASTRKPSDPVVQERSNRTEVKKPE